MSRQLVPSEAIPNDKTGNMLTAYGHIFCAIVGAGVLALPYTFTNLGWIAGPILLIIFYAISLLTSLLLADVYAIDGIEFHRYHLAVKYILSRWHSWGLTLSQMLNLVLVTIAYNISAATSMRRIAQLACEYENKDLDDCWDKTWKLTLLFGAAQVPLSMVPDLESLWFISALGTFTSFGYSTIALALGLKYASAHRGTVGGKSMDAAPKAFGILSSLGSIAFAYAFSVVLLEIQHTLRQPPKASVTMKRASTLAITSTFGFYFTVAVGGYSSLGNDAPSFILLGFPEAPRWVMVMANVCLLIHMLAAYQVFAQPIFDSLESLVKAHVFKGRYLKPEAGTMGIEAGSCDSDDDQTLTKGGKGGPSENDSFDGTKRSLAPPSAGQAASSFSGVTAVGGTAPDGSVHFDALGAPLSSSGVTMVSNPVAAVDYSAHSAAARAASEAHPQAAPGVELHRRSSIGERLSRLSRASAMYRISTGMADDTVLNNQERPLPLVVRFVVRTAYVVAVTVISCCLPFFSDIAGLSGAVTFWPLSVYFPIEMWRKVYHPKGWFNALLYTIEGAMLLVAVGATVGSIRQIIVSSSNYTVFGDG